MIFELMRDFSDLLAAMPTEHPRYRHLKLLDEALRRDVHFIDRHPTALFQCLWNTCWWYDCAEAGKHYNPPEGGWPAAGPPWKQPHAKLAAVCESWLEQRAGMNRRPWLRSLRPPTIPLSDRGLHIFGGHQGAVSAVAFAPDGSHVASVSQEDGTLRLWDLNTGAEVHRWPCEGARLAFDPSGARLISAGDHHLAVWQADTGQLLVRYETPAFQITALALSPDGRQLICGCADAAIRVLDPGTGEEIGCLRGHRAHPGGLWNDPVSPAGTFASWRPSSHVTAVAYSPCGRYLVSGGADQTVRVWDLTRFAESLCLEGHEFWVTSVAFGQGGRRIVSGSLDTTVRVWDATTGRELHCLRAPSQEQAYIHCVAFLSDSPRVIAGDFRGNVRMWDAVSGEQLQNFSSQEREVLAIAVAPDGQRICSGGQDSTVRVWRSLANQLPRLSDHTSGLTKGLFSPDGALLATAGWDGTVRLWDVASGRQMHCPGRHEKPATCLAFSPNGRCLAWGAADGAARIWDLQGRRLLACLRGHQGEVMSLNFSTDSSLLVTGGYDKTVRVWEASGARQLGCLHGHAQHVRQVAFAGSRELVCSTDAQGAQLAWNWRTQEATNAASVQNRSSAVPEPPGGVAARAAGGETVVVDILTDNLIAHWPARCGWLAAHPLRSVWAIQGPAYWHLVVLENHAEMFVRADSADKY